MRIASIEEGIVIVGKSDHQSLSAQLMDFIPASWTSVTARRRGGTFWTLMSAIGFMLAYVKLTIDNIKRELRLETASGNSLDIFGLDYSASQRGFRLFRKSGELDDTFRNRMAAELLRPKATKPAIRQSIRRVTGAPPIVIEAIDVNTMACWTGFSINGKSAVAHFAVGSECLAFNASMADDDPIAFQNIDGSTTGSTLANRGVGGWSGLQVGLPYHFFVFVLDNPLGASDDTVLSVVKRVKPVGTVEHVFIGK